MTSDGPYVTSRGDKLHSREDCQYLEQSTRLIREASDAEQERMEKCKSCFGDMETAIGGKPDRTIHDRALNHPEEFLESL